MAHRVLVTGFGPFGKSRVNPSEVLAASCGAPYKVLEVSWEAVDSWLGSGEADDYDTLIHLGLAARRRHMTPELFARNQVGKVKDVHGIQREGKIDVDAPDLLGSTLWTPATLARLLPEKRLDVSLDAGSYLCNYLSYCSLRRFPKKRIGFLHVPSFDEISRKRQLKLLATIMEALG